MRVYRSYQMPCPGLDYMALDPEAHYPELMAIAALGAVDEEEFLAELNAEHFDDPFPAARADPDARQGRRPT
jgi:hypothetical protein